MLEKIDFGYCKEWEPYFTWLPIKVDGKIVWLKPIWRRYKYSIWMTITPSHIYEYKIH